MRLLPRGRDRRPGASSRLRALLPVAARVLLTGVLALAGMLLGLRLAGPIERDTRLGRVSLRVAPASHGSVEAFIPIADWGVRAHAFRAPLRLRLEPRAVDRQALLAAAAGDRRVLSDTERDARSAADAALLRAFGWGAAGALFLGLAAGAALYRHRSWPVLAGWSLAPLSVAALLGGLLFLRIDATFEAAAFETPSFFARGDELAQLLKVADKAQESERRYRNSVQRTLSGYATLLAGGARLDEADADPRAVLVSDLHGNTVALDALERLFEGRPVFFAGDVGQAGTRAETRLLAPRLSRLGRPLVAVSGNHDSGLLMRRLAREGVIVLTERGRLRPDGASDGRPVQRVADLNVAGWPDPLEWRGADPGSPRRVFSFAEREDGERAFREAQDDLVGWFDRLSPRPDVVLVHQNGLAQALARELAGRADPPSLLILTGHDHEQHVDLRGQVVVADAGSAGAGGPFGVGTTAVGIARLFFAEGATFPEAVDLVRIEPVSGSAGADRIVLSSPDACELERVTCPDQPGDGD